MKSFLSRLHARVISPGQSPSRSDALAGVSLWWYSAMIFLACRSGDAIQAFIGLWLVPKYVGPQDLFTARDNRKSKSNRH